MLFLLHWYHYLTYINQNNSIMRISPYAKRSAGAWILATFMILFSCQELEVPDITADEVAAAAERLGQDGPNGLIFGSEAPGEASSPTSAGGVMPYIIAGANPGGNRTCTEVSSAFGVSFESSTDKDDYGQEAQYDLGPFTIKMTNGTFIEWTFNGSEDQCLDEVAFIVKGGNAANVYVYGGGFTSDSGLASPPNASDGSAGLSNLTICFTVTTRPDAPTVSVDSVEECYEEGVTESLNANDYITSSDPVKWFTTEDGDELANPIVTDLDTPVTLWAEAYKGNCVSSSRTPITLTLEDCGDEEDCYDWEGDTAWAATAPGNQRYTNRGNWATYISHSQGLAGVNIYAGQDKFAGTASISENNGTVTISIQLSGDFEFGDGEVVKVQSYAKAPSGNPAPGLFAHKNATISADKKSATITATKNNFYGIHLDVGVWVEVECPDEED